MMITGEDLKPYVFGYLETEIDEDGYLHFYRFTKKQREILAADSHKFVSRASSGVRLDITGDFKTIAFDYRFFNNLKPETAVHPTFDICENDIPRMHIRKLEAMGTEDHHLYYEMGGPGRFTIYFPTYSELSIKNLQIDGNFIPTPQGIKYLAHGDSISQGAFSEMNHETYVSLIQREFGFDLLNQSVSGYTFGKYPFDDIDFDPEIITVGYGTNDWSGSADLDTNSKVFFEKLKAQFPKAKVYVLTPIWRERKAYVKNPDGSMVFCEGNENLRGITLQ